MFKFIDNSFPSNTGFGDVLRVSHPKWSTYQLPRWLWENTIVLGYRIRHAFPQHLYINKFYFLLGVKKFILNIVIYFEYLGHTAQVCLLLKHRADQHIQDESGINPLSIAVKEANADIVTL